MATNVDAKLLKQTKFPPEFSQKVDMKKVNVEVMKKWIAGKISEILGSEDDVVIELCFNLLEGSRFPDIKVLQIQLTGFLDKDTPRFCKELWNLCLSAQSNPQGVPKELLEAKKLELIQEKTLRKLPRRPSVTKNKKGRGKRTLIISDSESEPNEDGFAEEETEVIMNTIDALAGIRDLHLQGAGSHRTEMISVAAIPRASPVAFTQLAIPSIRISLSDTSKEESGRGRKTKTALLQCKQVAGTGSPGWLERPRATKARPSR
ncbi:MAG: hypothetical protein Q9188_006357 [Gyalolechia gomerana]